jgi:glycerol 3-phosphatase-2
MTWAIDLDGCVWVGEEPVPRSAEAIAQLRERGQRLVFITNNSSRPVQDYLDKLAEMGIQASPDEVITSAVAAASMLEPGTKALVCGGVGVDEALRDRGVEVVDDTDVDAVVVGWYREFDYEDLTKAFTAVRKGARLIGTNDDPTYPQPGGHDVPGGGSILSAVAYAAGVEPEVAGKPNQPVADLVTDRVGDVELVVGDRPSTDGLLAKRMGARFVVVLSGSTHEDDLDPDEGLEVAPDLATLVERTAGDGQ